MRYECLPPKIREEHDRLAAQYFNQTEIDDWNEFEKKYASKAFIKFFEKLDRRRDRLYKKGIIED